MGFTNLEYYEQMVMNRWISIIFLSVFAIIAFYKLWFAHLRSSKKADNKPKLSIRILFTVYISCYISSFILSLYSFRLLRDYHATLWLLPASKFTILASFAVAMHVLSLCLYYIIMLVWLYSTFDGTSFSFNKMRLIVPYGIGLCTMSAGAVLYLYYKAQTNVFQKSSDYYYPIFLIMVVVINTVIGISIIGLFVGRLRRLIVASDDDEVIIHLMTKLTCLGGISITFVAIDCITISVHQLIVEEDRDWMVAIILWYSQAVVVWIEVICLFLTFRINKGIYDRLCCGCHMVLTKSIMRKVNKERRKCKQKLQMSPHQESNTCTVNTQSENVQLFDP